MYYIKETISLVKEATRDSIPYFLVVVGMAGLYKFWTFITGIG